MVALATLDDLADRLGRDLTDEEQRRATAWLDDATALILKRFPQYATTPTAISTKVCCAMVLRVLGNPEGKRQESIDDYSYTIDSSRSRGEVYLSDDEVEELRPPKKTAFSIVPSAPCTPAAT
ncbi:phage Gp19/Gp15/Gp42 family protein [Streptomyces sp. GMY02]|uniref:Gp19/Gp15/Gp42 family protein n=1 Tax=Streptomyces sp. GMY02 TaxID=1333528 RepID=UPI001C2C179D|nr:Gp19/Gp15/Gp42 family protein [Streptomyces sp. GMY02]QXE36206.1 phage Gp19/Gp15/Gp42 family protein [Streptomyces sp. GMY02]